MQGPVYPPEDVEAGKMWAVLGYVVSPLWIIPLVQRDNAFAVFHAKQALALFIFAVVASIPAAIIAAVTCGIGAVLMFAIFYPWIMGIIYAAQGEYKPLPWCGWIADKYLGGIQADQRPGTHGTPGAPPQAPGGW